MAVIRVPSGLRMLPSPLAEFPSPKSQTNETSSTSRGALKDARNRAACPTRTATSPPASTDMVAGGELEADFEQREGRGLLQEVQPPLDLLDLLLQLGDLLLDEQRVFHLPRPVQERKQPLLGGPEADQPGLAVDVLVGHVLAGDRPRLNFQGERLHAEEGFVQGLGRHANGDAPAVPGRPVGVDHPTTQPAGHVGDAVDGVGHVVHHQRHARRMDDDAVLGQRRRPDLAADTAIRLLARPQPVWGRGPQSRPGPRSGPTGGYRRSAGKTTPGTNPPRHRRRRPPATAPRTPGPPKHPTASPSPHYCSVKRDWFGPIRIGNLRYWVSKPPSSKFSV